MYSVGRERKNGHPYWHYDGERKQAVLNYLTLTKKVEASRVLVSAAKDEQLSRGDKPKFVINIAERKRTR